MARKPRNLRGPRNDHSGGIIRNNFICRSGAGDSAIYVADSPNTQVLHNSIFISGTYPSPIEYRFPHTTGVVIANNVLDGRVQARDGAAGSVSGNHTSATAAFFVSAAMGDLHLKPAATALLNRIVTPLANAAVDWDGHARPEGGTDVGADELLEGTGTPPAAPQGLGSSPEVPPTEQLRASRRRTSSMIGHSRTAYLRLSRHRMISCSLRAHPYRSAPWRV